MGTFTLIKSFIHFKLNEKRSRESMLKLQEKKFRKILKYAYKNSKFYHGLYKKNGIKESDLDSIDIKKLPIVDKDIIMNNFDKVLTDKNVSKKGVVDFLDKNKNPNDLYKDKYHILHTSGSSGKIGIYVYSRNDWDSFYPTITRAFYFNFFRKKRSVFFGAADGHYSGVSFSSWGKRGLISFFNKPLILDIKKPIKGIIKKLNDFQPNILGGYFTGLKILAEQQEKNELKINPESLLNAGEGINPKDKEYIEKIFDAPLLNSYGVAECSIMGVGRKEYGGIAIFDDIVLLEIKKDHILLTNLFNRTQPLIRYRIDDYLKPSKKAPKDFPFTVVEDVIGRQEMVMWLRNSKGKLDFIHPIVIAEFYVKGLDRLQIIIKGEKSFDFLAVINEKNKNEVIKKIKEKLDKLLAAKDFIDVKYKIKIVNDLKVDKKTGKFKLIIKDY
jgi:phenylacetate-CoA ligase